MLVCNECFVCVCVFVCVCACVRVSQAILHSHLQKLPSEEIREMMGEHLTNITLELHDFIFDKLPPTPSRFHYVFNLRDLSRLYEGLLLSTPDKIK